MEKNKDESKKERNDLLEIADVAQDIKIGGVIHQFYPLSLGKIGLLTEMLTDVMPVIRAFDDFSNIKESELLQLINKSIDKIAGSVKVLTHPNDGTEPPKAEPDYIKSMKYQLTPATVSQILVTIKGGFDFKEILKNVLTPKPESKESSVGSITLDG